MVFSAPEFLWFFLPCVLVAFLALPPKGRNPLLAGSSLLFYAWGAGEFLVVFLFSIALNYVAGHLVHRYKRAGREYAAAQALRASIILNLMLLFWWKYVVFAVSQINSISSWIDAGQLDVPAIVLPIGISFFTFHGISYVVDISRSAARPMSRIWDYVLYMAFFPQLVAGPIVRYHEIDDQIRAVLPRSHRLEAIAAGFPRFALGLAKKVLIADSVAPIANAAFGSGDPGFASAWIGALAYTIQIYFDFSGYSDMAIGMARMFGFTFPENFNRPYTAVSMTDFWRRWHMTLSRWFRDYLYIPLGGSRGSQVQTLRNLAIVFLLTGIWHGAAWTFLLWGAYHGSLLMTERLTGMRNVAAPRLVVARRASTFLLVLLGWVLFRADSLDQAGRMYAAMASPSSLELDAAVAAALTPQALAALLIGLLSVFASSKVSTGRLLDSETRQALVVRVAVLMLLPYVAVAVAAGTFSPFLYFQF